VTAPDAGVVNEICAACPVVYAQGLPLGWRITFAALVASTRLQHIRARREDRRMAERGWRT
jgi:hypothetical protein